MRFFIEMAYNGRDFHGWQKQPNAITIQETLEKCFAKIFQRKIEIIGAGRTDTGVHARYLVAHFNMKTEIDSDHLVYKLNRMLPASVAIHDIYPVKPEAHARFDAISRKYKYYVSLKKDPFTQDFSCLILQKINMAKMNQACEILKNHRNFQCFSKVKTDVKTYKCTIEKAYWEKIDNQLVFTIVADRFLRNMVRSIVGTLLEIGLGKRPLEDFEKVIASKNRSRAGKSMAAKGLFLHKIRYPENIKMI
ncbi:MAG TPA: tRNA pseudouridine(38-40) synthase TruA [Flavobacteriaceae bacterium]|nr:tRNA pseudouridine(38-40) synthase TruA [Flavobacteriaceae bacterium]